MNTENMKKYILCNFLYNGKTNMWSLSGLTQKQDGDFSKSWLISQHMTVNLFSPAAEAKQERTRSRNSSTLSLSPAGRRRSETCTDHNSDILNFTSENYYLPSYPIKAENGQPTIPPAATPITASGMESWNHPVMAIRVVYMQKEEGRKAEEKEQRNKNYEQLGRKSWQKPVKDSYHILRILTGGLFLLKESHSMLRLMNRYNPLSPHPHPERGIAAASGIRCHWLSFFMLCKLV